MLSIECKKGLIRHTTWLDRNVEERDANLVLRADHSRRIHSLPSRGGASYGTFRAIVPLVGLQWILEQMRTVQSGREETRD